MRYDRTVEQMVAIWVADEVARFGWADMVAIQERAQRYADERRAWRRGDRDGFNVYTDDPNCPNCRKKNKG